MSRLEVLENSLTRKKEDLARRIQEYHADVKSANGQPLNDKRGGYKVMERWEEQRRMIRKVEESIKGTEWAIDREKTRIMDIQDQFVPEEMKELQEAGILIQWRRFPNFFFVKGVEKGRMKICKNGAVNYLYADEIPDTVQFHIFARVFNYIRTTYGKRWLERVSGSGK